jgi:hypothetical protein
MCIITPAPILGHTWTIQAGTRETTKTVNGNKDVETGGKFNETEHSYLHRHLNQENSHEQETVPAVTRLHSRWSSSSRDVVDKPPSQPLSCRRMSRGRPSTSRAGTTTVRPPLLRGKAFRRLLHGACRWTSSSRSALDRVPTLAPRLLLIE